MREVLKHIAAIGRETCSAWLDDNGARLGAAFAFYSLFAVGPLLIVTLAVAGTFFGEAAATGELYRQLHVLFGAETAKSLETILAGSQRQGPGIVATVASLGTILVAATAAVIQLKYSLNTIWGVRPKPGRSITVFFKDYVVSLATLFALGVVLMTSTLVTAGLDGFGDLLGPDEPSTIAALTVLNGLVTFSFVTLLFAAMFKLLPDVRIQWRDALPGAVMTAVLLTAGRMVFKLYLRHQNFASVYGATASLWGVSLWIYYCSQIIFLGAEFTKVAAKHLGRQVAVDHDVDRVHMAVGEPLTAES